MNTISYNENRDFAEYHQIATSIMFRLVKSGDEFTADDFHERARNEAMPPHLIKRFAGAMFREFQAAGYIAKTARYQLSKRNGSTPLPVWIAASADYQ